MSRVQVATRPAENPVGVMARKLNLGGVVREVPKLSLPGKLVFPSLHNAGHFSMLGLGDIVSKTYLLIDAYTAPSYTFNFEIGVESVYVRFCKH